MNPFDVHLKLLRLLPIRTHQWEPAALPHTGRPRADETRRLHQAIIRLTTAGLSRNEVAKELGVALQTVRRHCRHCKWE